MWEVWITIGGIFFIFLMTALGSAVVFFFKRDIPEKANGAILGFASGVMVAASIWSLLIPSIQTTQLYVKKWAVVPVTVGLLLGAVFLVFLDKRIPVSHKMDNLEKFSREKAWRMFFAVSLHNIPEGLAVGFAFGVCARGDIGGYLSALALAVGIGLQNFPEGMAVTLPMKGVYKSNRKAFLWGVFSGVFEPVFAFFGYVLASKLRIIQPLLLAFSAGAMLFVSAEDLLPDSKTEQSSQLGAWGFLLGFALMMSLDVALG